MLVAVCCRRPVWAEDEALYPTTHQEKLQLLRSSSATFLFPLAPAYEKCLLAEWGEKHTCARKNITAPLRSGRTLHSFGTIR